MLKRPVCFWLLSVLAFLGIAGNDALGDGSHEHFVQDRVIRAPWDNASSKKILLFPGEGDGGEAPGYGKQRALGKQNGSPDADTIIDLDYDPHFQKLFAKMAKEQLERDERNKRPKISDEDCEKHKQWTNLIHHKERFVPKIILGMTAFEKVRQDPWNRVALGQCNDDRLLSAIQGSCAWVTQTCYDGYSYIEACNQVRMIYSGPLLRLGYLATPHQYVPPPVQAALTTPTSPPILNLNSVLATPPQGLRGGLEQTLRNGRFSIERTIPRVVPAGR